MDYTIFHADGSCVMTVTTSPESVQAMVPPNGYLVEGHQHLSSTCVDGVLVTPSDAEIEEETNHLNLAVIREERNRLLAKTDWTQSPDSPLSETEKENYRVYRQNLRDMPQSDGLDLLNPEWPTLP